MLMQIISIYGSSIIQVKKFDHLTVLLSRIYFLLQILMKEQNNTDVFN